MTTIQALSGPNLDLLGIREPEIYGVHRLEDHVHAMVQAAYAHRLELVHHQTNHEGELVELVHEAIRAKSGAIIINPGAFTHYAWSLHDALAAFPGPVIEVHLSNPAARDSWRSTSVVAPVATATISGLGGRGLVMAVDAVADLLA
jgi:3-dehydroquinate dehydratase-2